MLGTANEREEARPPADARGLAGIEVRTLADEPLRLGELWAERPGVLVFLRHYG